MSVDQYIELTSPSKKYSDAVQHWLQENGAKEINVTINRGFMTASCSIKQAATMFGLEVSDFHRFQHSTLKDKACVRSIKPIQPTISSIILLGIDFFSGINDFPCTELPLTWNYDNFGITKTTVVKLLGERPQDFPRNISRCASLSKFCSRPHLVGCLWYGYSHSRYKLHHLPLCAD